MTKQQLQAEVGRLQDLLRKAEAENAVLRGEMPPHISRVFLTVAKHCGVAMSDIIGRSRVDDIAVARGITEYILRKPPYRMSLKAIARHIGGRHHTTILTNIRHVTDYISVDTEFSHLVERIQNDLK